MVWAAASVRLSLWLGSAAWAPLARPSGRRRRLVAPSFLPQPPIPRPLHGLPQRATGPRPAAHAHHEAARGAPGPRGRPGAFLNISRSARPRLSPRAVRRRLPHGRRPLHGLRLPHGRLAPHALVRGDLVRGESIQAAAARETPPRWPHPDGSSARTAPPRQLTTGPSVSPTREGHHLIRPESSPIEREGIGAADEPGGTHVSSHHDKFVLPFN
jgi:hypothetical protein